MSTPKRAGQRRGPQKGDAKDAVIEVQLTGRVVPAPPPIWVTQRQLCSYIGNATTQSIRNWESAGLPVSRVGGRPRYNLTDSLCWYFTYALRRERAGRGARTGYVSLESAREEHLSFLRRENPDRYAIVPLEHDHPLRAEQLERAAQGMSPPPGDADDAQQFPNDEEA